MGLLSSTSCEESYILNGYVLDRSHNYAVKKIEDGIISLQQNCRKKSDYYYSYRFTKPMLNRIHEFDLRGVDYGANYTRLVNISSLKPKWPIYIITKRQISIHETIKNTKSYIQNYILKAPSVYFNKMYVNNPTCIFKNVNIETTYLTFDNVIPTFQPGSSAITKIVHVYCKMPDVISILNPVITWKNRKELKNLKPQEFSFKETKYFEEIFNNYIYTECIIIENRPKWASGKDLMGVIITKKDYLDRSHYDKISYIKNKDDGKEYYVSQFFDESKFNFARNYYEHLWDF